MPNAIHELLAHASAPADAAVMTIERWNEPSLWLASYGEAASGCTFFAEDVFGTQF
jgi:hypothetical protein